VRVCSLDKGIINLHNRFSIKLRNYSQSGGIIKIGGVRVGTSAFSR
jgi:hypothetical protein